MTQQLDALTVRSVEPLTKAGRVVVVFDRAMTAEEAKVFETIVRQFPAILFFLDDSEGFDMVGYHFEGETNVMTSRRS